MKKNYGVALALLLCLAAVPAIAQDAKGFYLGGSLGSGESKNTCEGIIGRCDDTDTAYKLFGGYHVNENFAWELAYGYLGDVAASGTFAGAPLNFEVTNKALDFSGIVTVPVNERFSVFGRFGIYRSQVELHGNLPGLQGADHNTSFTWGLGMRFHFGRAFALRAEWQQYPDIGGGNAGVDDMNVLTGGVEMRF